MPCVFFVRRRSTWIGNIDFEDFEKDFVEKMVDGNPWAYLVCTGTTQ